MLESFGFPYVRVPEAEAALENDRLLEALEAADDDQFLMVASALCSRFPCGFQRANAFLTARDSGMETKPIERLTMQ